MSWAPPWFVQRWQSAFKERMREQGGAVVGSSSSQGSELELQNVGKNRWVSVWLGQLCLTTGTLKIRSLSSLMIPHQRNGFQVLEKQFSNKTNFCSIKTKIKIQTFFCSIKTPFYSCYRLLIIPVDKALLTKVRKLVSWVRSEEGTG